LHSIVTPTKYFWQRTTFTSVEEYFMASTVLYCVCILLDMYVGHPTSSFRCRESRYDRCPNLVRILFARTNFVGLAESLEESDGFLCQMNCALHCLLEDERALNGKVIA